MKKRFLSLLVSFGLLAGLIYFSDAGRIVEMLSKTNPYYVFIALLVWLVIALLRTARWQYLLKKININIRFLHIMKIYIIGLFISNLTPAKTGEPIRSFLLKKTKGEKIGATLSSIFLERLCDIFSIAIISIFGILLLTTALSSISLWISAAIIFYIILFSAALFIIISENRTKTFTKKIYKIFSFIPKIKKFENKIEEFSLNLHRSFLNYKSKETLFVTIMLSLLIWVLDGVILFLAFLALGLKVTLLSTIVIIPIAALISILTFLPGGIGIAEIVTVMFFTSLFPLTIAEVTATVLLGRLLSFWMYAIVGSVIFSTLKYKYKVIE